MNTNHNNLLIHNFFFSFVLNDLERNGTDNVTHEILQLNSPQKCRHFSSAQTNLFNFASNKSDLIQL